MADLAKVTERVIFWRRTDVQGIERLELSAGVDGISVRSTVLCEADGGFQLDHCWELDGSWSTRILTLQRKDSLGTRRLALERTDTGWCVDGELRADLADAAEPDLSVTPFCNTLAIRKTPAASGASFTIVSAFIDGSTLEVACSKQRYIRKGPRRLRYVDLGLFAGFEADLIVDSSGLVLSYEGLFERIVPAGSREDISPPFS